MSYRLIPGGCWAGDEYTAALTMATEASSAEQSRSTNEEEHNIRTRPAADGTEVRQRSGSRSSVLQDQ